MKELQNSDYKVVSLFQYPKSLHKRTLSPRQRKSYRGYKPYLQREFSRLCVYCQQPDSYSPNLNFGVDHYRPKSIRRFAALECKYDNLFYCCGNCNSRKRAYWPIDDKAGPFIVNPCDFKMTDHVRFDSVSGRVVHKTKHGEQTVDLLQLNCEELVAFRKSHILMVKLANDALSSCNEQLKKLHSKLKREQISQANFDLALLDAKDEQRCILDLLDSLMGSKKLNPIRSLLPH